ncbi:LysR family transcriptional regulator [Brevibacterium litoralis]|uniref:LysR family transcriptional regulator n=1 Tax=Brevibacterium litoralis TaxID=3138935 RepID=UPI0032EAD760
MQWTLGQLRTFVAVAEHGTLTRAAAQLGYTPGALSQHMSALRRAVGVDLVVHRGRHLVLTEEGRLLLPRARAVLAAETQAAEAVRGGQAGRGAVVTLGVFGSASVVAFAPTRAQLAGTGIQLPAREVDVEQMQEAVEEGRIDVGLGIDYPASPLAPQRGLLMEVVRRERFGFVVPGDHPDPTPEQLQEADWILAPNDTTFGRGLRFACAEAGIAPRESHIVMDSAVALAMVGGRMGFTLATPIMMSLAPASVRLVEPVELSGRDIVVIAREDMAARPEVATVVDALRTVFAG